MNLTVVIPALDAAATIGETLGTICGLAEVIVVDGGSRDATKDIAVRHGARPIDSKRGRGCQLAAGAGAAAGEWLLFLHADTRLEAGWGAVVASFMESPRSKACAATFRFKLDDDCWQASSLQRLVGWRARVLGLPYGDQGLLIHRDFYAAIGGYPDWPLMEDVELVRKIGRNRLVTLRASAVTSATRWKKEGWLARSLRNSLCLSLFYMGVSPRLIARLYG
ncbi:MAG: TIGR04283 family arsenosugar biosynthesis glycosyltransferase [Rhizobiales bacterium]|nr:TIGR04283 family arsenosugar biosynthesis glycosyltransferase [Hyphomicrobiales bacterium]